MWNLLSLFLSHNILLAAVMSFGLGMWVYFDRRQDARNVTLGSLLITASFWSFAFLLWHLSVDSRQTMFWLKTLYFTGSLLPAFYLFFALSQWRGVLPRWWWQLVLVAVTVVNAVAIYGTSIVIVAAPHGEAPTFGAGRMLLAVYFAVVMLVALVIMMLAARREIVADRTKFITILVGTILAFNSMFAVMFGMSLSASAGSFWMANVALLSGIFIVAIGVVRGRFLIDLRLVSVEAFVLLTLFIVVADIVVAQSVVDFTLRLTTLIVLIFYGTITMRSIVRESHRLRELASLTEQVQKINGHLIEADKTKTLFLSLATHQLRAPLSGIRSYLDMMAKGDFGPVSDKQRSVLQTNVGVVGQTLQTVETFLNAAKISLGRFEIYKSPTNMGELVKRVVATVLPLAEQRNLHLEIAGVSNLDMVECDGSKIYHVLINLIDNAIKYTEHGIIRIVVVREEGRIYVRVIDSGCGLDPSELKHLFEMFSRGVGGLKLNTDGSGLGLYIVKKIVEAHGGDVVIESEGRGHGSMFGFWIPV